jgi:hypothetical protein
MVKIRTKRSLGQTRSHNSDNTREGLLSLIAYTTIQGLIRSTCSHACHTREYVVTA